VGTYHTKRAQCVIPTCSTNPIHHSPASNADMYNIYIKTCCISTIFLWILDTKI